MAVVNLLFPVLGTAIPGDHGYALYGSLARVIPSLHGEETQVLIGPIPGDSSGNGSLQLNTRRSFLRLRLAAEQIGTVLPLAGKPLDIDGHRIRLGMPRVLPIIPAPALIARMVTLKKSSRQDAAHRCDYMVPELFLDAVRRTLQQRGIQGEPSIPLVERGAHEGKPRRHILRIRDCKVVGFSVQVIGLSAEESVQLQEQGLGGRKKMGCGFFVPMRMA